MADISLRDYLAKLDTLLKSGSAAEVILHCRHILQYFPKDAQAYRLLGQALVATSRWAEAGEVMRRVLSIYPDDREAHAGLSEVYRIEKRPDDAIWHLERAFEQSPNDQTILDNLREMYRKYHKTEHGKVQLTAAAVARQYIRNGLYEQAIEILQKARTASPERYDLPLLLAQTYWDRGQRVEAAQTALEVLKVLPDCLVANTLLAAMWLTESRPSDAQRYIGRIESLDPYLALELAQGQEVPDNAFKLEELDYQRAAEREMMVGTPDWLSDVTSTGEMKQVVEEDINAVPDFFNDITVDEDIVANTDFNRDLTSADWGDTSDDLPYLGDNSSPAIPKKTTGSLASLSERFSKPPTGSLSPDAAAKTNVPGARRGLTGRLNPVPEQMPPPEPVADDLFSSFMQDIAPDPTEDSAAPDETGMVYTGELPDMSNLVMDTDTDLDTIPSANDLPFRRERVVEPEDNDPLAWLRSTGVEINEETPEPVDNDLYDADADNLALQDVDVADPLAWLQGYGGNDLMTGQNAAPYAPQTDDLPVPEDQAGDPLAWLQSTEPTPSTSDSRANFSAPNDDPLDWLSDDSLLDEAFDLESLVNNQTSMPEQLPTQAEVSPMASTPDWQDTMADEKDPLDWLSSEPESENEPNDSFTWMEDDQPTPAAPSKEDFPDWLNTSATSTEIVDGAGVSAENDIDWMTDLPDLGTSEPVEAAKPAGSSMLNWLGKQTSDLPDMPVMAQPEADVPDWLSDLKTETPASTPSKVDENGFEWMSTADELPPVATSNDIPDWMSSMDLGDEAPSQAEPLATADEPDWMSSMNIGDDSQAEPLAAADTPDWLSEIQPEELKAEPLAAADSPDWLSSMDIIDDEPVAEPLATADEPDWMSSMNIGDDSQAEPLAAADTPDWLSDMQPEELKAEPLAAADAPDWLSSLEPDDQPEEEPLAIADTPDWLSSMDIADDEPVAEPLANADEPDWLSDMQPEELKAEPLAAADAPDWLSSLEPDDQPEEEPLAIADTPDWLSSMDIADDEPVAEPRAAADAPDWLSSLEPDDQPEEEPLAIADTPDWLSSMDIADDEPVAEPLTAADAPDWLSSLEPDDQPEEEPLAIADTPDWLSGMSIDETPKAEAEPEKTQNVPEWLTRAEPHETAKALTEAAEIHDWVSSIDSVDEPNNELEPLAVDDTPDWLSSMDIADEPKAEPMGIADTPDWLSELQPEDDEPQNEPEPLGIADTPDWLAAMQPEDDEFEPITDDEPMGIVEAPDWLSSMDTADEPNAEPLSVADTPDWLSSLEPDDEPQSEPEPLGIADTPDWLAAMQPEDDQPQSEPEPLGMADAPDWLAAMQPEDDQPQSEPEPLGMADAPDWLAAMQPEDDQPQSEPEPLAMADTPDWLAAMQPEDDQPESQAEPIIDDTPDWLSAMQQPNEPQPVVSTIRDAATPAKSVPDWLSDVHSEVPDAEQPMNEDEWDEAAELAPEMTADVPDWLSAMDEASPKASSSDETTDTYQWEDAPAEESMPAAPAPATNAPDWLNAMVPGLDVDYDAPEDEPVETEYLPTNRATPSKPAPAKESKTRPEFGWLLDIVSEESQQVTVVADKTALRRFVFSRLPTWLRKPTEQPDKSPAGDSESDNVDIPPWLQ